MNREKRVLEKNSPNIFEEMPVNGFNLFLDRNTRCLDLIASRYRHFDRGRYR